MKARRGAGMIDYGWIPMLGIAILLVVFWKPMMKGFADFTGGTQKKEVIARGKIVFEDSNRWAGKYKSCAMCHTEGGFKPEAGKKIEMSDYKEGQFHSLKGVAERNGGVLTGEDQLLSQINDCLTLPQRIGVGKVSTAAPFMVDLIAYLKSL